MVIRVRLEPIAETLRVMVGGGSEKEQRKLVADFARREIAKADEINKRVLGRVPPKETTVDGRLGAALESVKLNGGQIVTEWEIFNDVLTWIASTLKQRSPRISGDYIRGHKLFADGIEIPVSNNPKPASEYVFLNTVPYARKIEIGKTKSGRDFVIQVPNRIYENVARDARSRFGNVANIRFSYREEAGAYQLRRSAKRKSAALRAPAIIVKIKGS